MCRPTVAAGSVLLLSVTLITVAYGNMAPEIQIATQFVCEDLLPGDYAFTILARDEENDVMRYAISGMDARFFNVDPNNGIVTVRVPLDRETSNELHISVNVSDHSASTVKEQLILLNDANDNPPIFVDPSYNIDVKENTTVNTILFTVSATDEDTGLAKVVKYRIEEVTPGDGMRLFTIDQSGGHVKLSQPLNYTSLSTFYRLKIIAYDGGLAEPYKCLTGQPLASFTYAFITVLDVPDLNPRFLALPYRRSIKEGSPVGTTVLTVIAIDQDTGVNDIIVYSIEASRQPMPFTISDTTGVISVLSDIDRETISGNIALKVKATEQNPNILGLSSFATADVEIFIVDINDNKPIFYSCGSTCVEESQFKGEIFENSAGTLQINMTVKDLDQNSQIQMEVEGVDKAAFAVSPSDTISESTVQLVVKDPQQLDFEKKEEMVVEVIAIDMQDTSFRSTATVTIQILDTNDNSPTFPHDSYKLNLPEHSVNGTDVDVITAVDKDQMDQGKLTYRLLPLSIHKYFNVDNATGRVYVANSELIDRERMPVYSATLQASDTNNNIGTTVLEISLTDINDQPPKINRESYTEFVQEGKQLSLQIEATDADDPETPNSIIVYAIKDSKYSSNFTIDPDTGVLTNNGELDREAIDPKDEGVIELNITATDKGVPALLTEVTVIVNVEDTNDNKPIFKAGAYDFTVKEGAKGAFVGSVQAVDLDQASDFNRISFSIIDGSFGSFIIRTFPDAPGYQGNITVDPDIELDYEKQPNSFLLRVEAADLSMSKAEVMLMVKVLDVNDERPEFQPSEPLTVTENSSMTGPLGHFSALDKDCNHSLVYQMESCKCRCNGTLEPCDWMLLDSAGEVTANPEAKLDYEKCDQVLLEAQVVDVYTENGLNNSANAAVMVINIEDINDNAPEFIISDDVIVVVSETASMGTSVARVTATDRDSGVNKEIEFKVAEVRFENTDSQISGMRTIFEAVTTQQKDSYIGIIQSTEALDSDTKGKYLVNVTATDRGGLSASTELEIFIIDKSFKVQLRFGMQLAEVIQSRESITLALSAATKAAVYVVSIRPELAVFRAPGDTLMESYFVYRNGTALSSVEVEKKLAAKENFLLLAQYNLNNVGMVTVIPKEVDTLKFVLFGVVGGLVIVLTVLATSLVCTRRSYRTKLKAAKAMKSTTMEATDQQRGGPVVPGTNKYTMEGANPVLNLNIDTVTDLGFDEDSSNMDKVSVDSFDDGMSLQSEKERTMMVIQEEDEESLHIEPLGAALAQRANKQQDGGFQIGFTNPAFSTTDL